MVETQGANYEGIRGMVIIGLNTKRPLEGKEGLVYFINSLLQYWITLIRRHY